MDNFDLKEERCALWQTLATDAGTTPFPCAQFNAKLQQLCRLDRFWAYPGSEVLQRLSHYLELGQYTFLRQLLNNCHYQLHSGRYRQQCSQSYQTTLEQLDRPLLIEAQLLQAKPDTALKPYFEVLIVHPFPEAYQALCREKMATFKQVHDEFVYDIFCVNCAQDALTAVLANPDIQACVYWNGLVYETTESATLYAWYSAALQADTPPYNPDESVELNLCRSIRCLRPCIDHYLLGDHGPVELSQRDQFDRVLFNTYPFHELHTAILNGVRNRFCTPFFDALQAYSRQPKGIFHALPLSRGASIKGSPWIHDMLDFYGDKVFLAETSSTLGGLDSLLDPTGAIKQAHGKAAKTFGADASYFVTNGTSTSNKIVMQANLRPGDIVLVSADCHKSIPYSIMLTGAYPIFLETYPLIEHDLYGGISLAQIKNVMLDLKKHGRLAQLKQITLTNSTFDGLIYHCEKYMMEILALKPDIIFHWDEAWSAFAHFHPLYHGRTSNWIIFFSSG